MTRKQKGRTALVGLCLILVGLVMRAPITTVPLMLAPMADGLHVKTVDLGVLTTIPLVMFVVAANFAAKTMVKVGLKPAMTAALSLVLIGGGLRALDQLWLVVLGTILVGLGIAHLNVYLPTFITAYFPLQAAKYTSLYSLAMMSGVVVFSLLTSAVLPWSGWQGMMVLLCLIPLLALGLWQYISRDLTPHYDQKKEAQEERTSLHVWRNPSAWIFLLMFGMQSLINYTAIAWLPTMMAYYHVPTNQIALIMAAYSMMGIPLSVLMPTLIVKLNRRGLTDLVAIVALIGAATVSLVWQMGPHGVTYWLILALLFGSMTTFTFLYTMTMFTQKTTTPYETATLSGMAQSGGYVLAAIGPALYGQAFVANPEGVTQKVIYLILVVILMTAAFASIRVTKIFK